LINSKISNTTATAFRMESKRIVRLGGKDFTESDAITLCSAHILYVFFRIQVQKYKEIK
jgi:hypothetical protein